MSTAGPRRVGLSRTSAPLLRTFSNPKDQKNTSSMAPKTAAKVKVPVAVMSDKKDCQVNSQKKAVDEDDDDLALLRPPDSSSDEDERGIIKPSNLVAGSGKPPLSSSFTTNTAKPKEKKLLSGTALASRSSARRTGASILKSSPQSPKRKSQEDVPSKTATDIFGNLPQKITKKAKLSYGKKQKTASETSQSSVGKSSQGKPKTPTKFSVPDLDSSPEKSPLSSPEKQLQLPSAEGLDSPISSPENAKSKKVLKSSTTSLANLKSAIDDSEDEDDPMPDVFTRDTGLDSPEAEFNPDPHEKNHIEKYNQQATQAQPFQHYDFDESGLLTQANNLLHDDDITIPSIWTVSPAQENHHTQTQHSSICPMCHAPVDPSILHEAGIMTTRAQENFCRTHRRKDAETQWTTKGYPLISWDHLPQRLLNYIPSLENWINGAPSHYRNQYTDSLSKGQNRTLRKAGSNLVPGYYGPRGARVVSEFIMEHFTTLLKQRAPKDRVMSKRSVTAYVQAVLVMEVVCLLIMEDMSVDEDEARGVLQESIPVGELLCPEVGDKISRKVSDSDDDNGDEGSEDELA